MTGRHCWCFHWEMAHMNGHCDECQNLANLGAYPLQPRHRYRTIGSLPPVYLPAALARTADLSRAVSR